MKKNVSTLLLLCFFLSSFAQTVAERNSVQISAMVSDDPASVTLTWEPVPGVLGYAVYKKLPSDISWGQGSTFPSNVTQISDQNVAVGNSYEYRILGVYQDTTFAFGHILVNVLSVSPESRGGLLLVIDSTFKTSLAGEIEQLSRDYAGEGYAVYQLYVDRNDTPQNVKSQIITEAADTSRPGIQYMLLLGHVPVPYSGNFSPAPDGHDNHEGAWPTDHYYADLDGTWTDNSVNNTTAARQANQNVPGDGKFDQSNFTSALDIYTGRVDFANMPAFAESETELLRNYMNKLHAYKMRMITYSESGIIDDNFQNNDEGFAQNGWANFGPLVGPDNVSAGDYFPELNTTPHLWSYGCGPGDYTRATGVGNTTDFASGAPQGIFTMLFGSYFGDWDNENNFLRAALASGNTLANIWSGRPNTFLHHMGAGRTLGYSFWLSQMNPFLVDPNDPSGLPMYNSPGFFSGGVHQSLMGDPALKNRYTAPAQNLTHSFDGPDLMLNWTAADAQNILGYFVYFSNNPHGPFLRITQQVLPDTQLLIGCVPEGETYFMVRSVGLEITPSGAYFDYGTGIINDVLVDSTTVPPIEIQFAKTDVTCFGDSDGLASGVPLNGSTPISYLWSTGDTTDVIRNVPAGTYSLTVSDVCGRTATGSVEVGEPSEIMIGLTTTDETGNDRFDGTARVNPSGGNPPYTITWSVGGMNMNPNRNLPPGNHSVTITDNGGCAVSEVFTINEFACPSITATAQTTDAACPGGTGQVSFSFNGAAEPVTYDLNPPGDYAAGLYQFSGTDANGCPFGGVFTIEEPDEIIIDLALTGETAPGQNDGTATANISGGTPPYTYSWDGMSPQANNFIGNLLPGTHEILVSDANGCSQAITFTINDSGCNLATDVAVSNPQCAGSLADVQITVSGGTPPYTFNQNGPGQYDGGTYQFSGTDASGCPFLGSFTITIPDEITVFVQTVNASCGNVADGSAEVVVSGGTGPYTIIWSTGSAGPTISNLLPGTIIVEVEDSNGCRQETDVTIGADDMQAPTVIGRNLVIFLDDNGLVQINPNELDDGSFDNCGQVNLTTNIQTFTCDNIGPNTVTLTATDGSGNQSSTDVTVRVRDDIAPDLLCPDNITVSGCEVPVNYDMPVFNDNCSATLSQIQGFTSGDIISEGTYTLEFSATDPTGNTSRCNFTVTVASDLEVVSLNTTNVSCFGDADGEAEIMLTGGINPTVDWEPGAQGNSISGLSPGNYSATVSDDTGCEIIETFTIGEPDELTANIDNQEPDNGNATGSADVSVGGGTPPFAYEWRNENGDIVSTDQDLQNVAGGNYALVVTDQNGCTTTISVMIDLRVGTRDFAFPGEVNVFPNPTDNILNVVIRLQKIGDFKWTLMDGRGKTIRMSPILSGSHFIETIPVADLASGIYMIRLESEGAVTSRRIFIE